jgi:Flp pilus assembly secretin CpaC
MIQAHPAPRGCGRLRGKQRLVAAALVTAALWVAPRQAGGAGVVAPATLGGIIVEPDGNGARVRIAISRPGRYALSAARDRVVVVLDAVAASAASYRLAVGPVLGILVAPVPGSGARAQIAIVTRAPMSPRATREDTAIVVTLTPRSAAPHGDATHAPAPAGAPSSAAAPGPAPGHPTASPDAAAPQGSARGSDAVAQHPPDRDRAGLVSLEEGAGRLLAVDGLVRVAVADPRVLGVVPVSDRELLVTGRAPGRTTMYVWDGTNRARAYEVQVTPALDRLAMLRGLLATAVHGGAITLTEIPAGGAGSEPVPPPGVPAGTMPPFASGRSGTPAPPAGAAGDPAASPAAPGGPTAEAPAAPPRGWQGRPGAAPAIVLSGSVETQLDRQRAEEIARVFAPAVVDLLTVRRPIQIKLQVEVVEIERSAARSLGVVWGGGQVAAGAAPSLNGGVYNLQVITGPGPGAVGLDVLIAQLQALIQQGRARLLAEPSLVVLAGTSASLLLGGQVPVPIAGANGSVTVDYKNFGVILNARPDYQDDGRVFMQVEPEVSTLDFADAVKANGFTIPALRVRRAQTTVSMRPAETLVLGGLLQQQDTRSLQKLPLLGDLPVIGALFRSEQFQRDETDLVIFITPLLVDSNDSPARRP